MLEKLYLAWRVAGRALRAAASSSCMLRKRDTSGDSVAHSSNSAMPTPPITSPSSLSGRRITTSGFFGASRMSSRMGWPVSTTSRMRLLGITSSTRRPIAAAGSSKPKRRAWRSLIQAMRHSRSTISVPSLARSKARKTVCIACSRSEA